MNTAARESWKQLAESLRRFVGRRVRDEHAAEDIVQDVMLKLQARLDGSTTEETLAAWLFTTARTTVIDHYRSRRRADNSSGIAINELEAPPVGEERGVAEELSCCLHEMIRQLPRSYREALVLADMEGLTQQEVADRFGISLSGAKSRVQRARQQLKTALLACCDFERDARGGLITCTSNERAKECCDDNPVGTSPCG
jgi:RNA polymerase sigma-70 factor (ECF subfamily)